MDRNFLKYYEEELGHVREHAVEFSKAFPKIARRLSLDTFEVNDPYVERLLEGFAYLAARVRLKVDAEFPGFTQHLLEILFPNYLSPTPSMGIVQLQPDLRSGTLLDGYTLPAKETALRSYMLPGDQTACEYRTAHDVTLWPIELVEAKYLSTPGSLPPQVASSFPRARSGLQLRLRATIECSFSEMPLDTLSLHLRGGDKVSMYLYEFLTGRSIAVALHSAAKGGEAWTESRPASRVRPIGFDDAHALLPCSERSFNGYRLLEEYFAFSERFMFVELCGLRYGLERCKGNELFVTVLFDHQMPDLEASVDVTRFALFCTPVINLFPKRADPITINDKVNEFHIVPDRNKPVDFEVFSVTSVEGYGTGLDDSRTFRPLYARHDLDDEQSLGSHYSTHRRARIQALQSRRGPRRSEYMGTEVFLSLVDSKHPPYGSELRQLSVNTLCTNRGLPIPTAIGSSLSYDFSSPTLSLETGAPISSVRFVSGPTAPHPPLAEGETAWRLINHLSLNYLSIVNNDPQKGAAALRDLLEIYIDPDDAMARKQIEGVTSIATTPTYRRLPLPGPVTFGRGLKLSITLDENAFSGSGIFLLGAVLEQFFARYVAINSFTETTLISTTRGEIKQWRARPGHRHIA